MPRRFRNTRRENRLEELGRVDAERAHTSRGKRNLREEKDRIRSELAIGGVAKSAQHPHSKLKTQKELKKITDSSAYKKADYKGKTKMLGGSTYTAAEMEKRINKATGGRAQKSPSDTPRKPRPKAGPSAPSPRKKYFKSKTHGGGPDSGNIGKIKDMISKHKDKFKVLGRSPKSSLDDLRKKFKRKEEYMKPLRKGGSAKGPNRPRPQGPHMWVRGDKRKKYAAGSLVKKGVKKLLSKLGKEIKKQPLPKKTKDLNKKFKKAFPGHDSKGKLKTTRPGYSSGGAVMAGKKVGCQIK